MKMEDKVVLISGGSGAIGRATAMKFAREGSQLVVTSKTRPERAEELVAEIQSLGRDALHIQADLADPDQVEKVFHYCVEQVGVPDVFVSAAGATVGGGPLDQLAKNDWENALEQNLYSAVLPAQRAANVMRGNEGGRIVIISSIRGVNHCGRSSIIAYSAAKSALNSFAKTLAKEVAPTVLVNAIAPGFVYTPNYDAMSEDLRKSFIDATLVKRFLRVDEIADAIFFLASSDAITGEVMVVDGGYSLKLE